MNTTKCVMDSIKKQPTSCWGCLACIRPPPPTGPLQDLATHTPTLWLAPYTHSLWWWWERFGRQLVNMYRKLAWICRPRKDHKLELKFHLWENKRETVSTWAGMLQDEEKANKLKNSATKGRKKSRTNASNRRTSRIDGLYVSPKGS